jgi:hypothetical protein
MNSTASDEGDFDFLVVNLPSDAKSQEKIRLRLKKSEEFGDNYTFLAIDRTSKLILTHQIGKRDSSNTRLFVSRLREAIVGNCHITSDGFAPYTQAVPVALWDKEITFAQLIKVFATQTPREESRQRSGSPKFLLHNPCR